MLNRLSIILILCAVIQPGFAQSSCDPDLTNLPVPKYFSSLYADAVAVGSYINDNRGLDTVSQEVSDKFTNFAREVRTQASSKLAHLPLNPQLQIQLDAFLAQAESGLDRNNLPAFSVSLDPFSPDVYIYAFTNNTDGQEGTINTSNPLCTPEDTQLPGCIEGLQALADAIEPYKAAYSHCSAIEAADNVARLTANWQRYLDESRSQTFTDMLLTTWLEKDHLTTNHLVGAMKRQWFFLHPSFVIENVADAPDGSNTQEAIALEWFGVNWWDKKTSPVGFPFGISLTSLYSDRATVDDVAHGVMFHLDNKYSVGWASHDGDNGIYVTVDLLAALQNKKTQWKKLESKINDYASQLKY